MQYPGSVLLSSIDHHSRSTRHAGNRSNAELTGSRNNHVPVNHVPVNHVPVNRLTGSRNNPSPISHVLKPTQECCSHSTVKDPPPHSPPLSPLHPSFPCHHVPPSRASITCLHHVHPSRASITCIHHVHPSRACVLSPTHDTLDANRLLSIHFTLYHRPPPRQIDGCALAETLFGAL